MNRPFRPIPPPQLVAFTTTDRMYHRLEARPMWEIPGPACGDPQPYRVKSSNTPDVSTPEMCRACYPELFGPPARPAELLGSRPQYHNRTPIVLAMLAVLIVWAVVAYFLVRS